MSAVTMTPTLLGVGLPVASPVTWTARQRTTWQTGTSGAFPARTVMQSSCITSERPPVASCPSVAQTVEARDNNHDMHVGVFKMTGGAGRSRPGGWLPVALADSSSRLSVVLSFPARTDEEGAVEGGGS